MAPYSTGFGCGLGSELLLLSHAMEKVLSCAGVHNLVPAPTGLGSPRTIFQIT